VLLARPRESQFAYIVVHTYKDASGEATDAKEWFPEMIDSRSGKTMNQSLNERKSLI
jgi:hypothetical protein